MRKGAAAGRNEEVPVRTIRELRQERAWSQYELAVMVGVHPQAVYLWESGRRTPQVPHMRKLGRAFGLCSDDIALVAPAAARRAARGGRSTEAVPEDRAAENGDDGSP